MIIKLCIAKQYGKLVGGQINRIGDEHDEMDTVYAHSMDEALAWLKNQPLFAGLEPQSLGDDRMQVTSKWMEVGPMYSWLVGYEDKTHVCQQIVLIPENTVGISVGYR